MKRYWPAIRDTYLRADRRALGLCRIGVGFTLLYEIIRRYGEAGRLYSNSGVLANHYLLFSPQADPQFSIFFLFSSPGEVKFAFALTTLLFACYTLGFLTRAMQVMTFAVYASLNARNLFFEDGGVCTTILLLGWTMFLPLGDRFSIDALLKAVQARSLRQRVELRNKAGLPVTSVACLALLLQACAIYYFNAVHKTGHTWHNGDAVHFVLWQHRINTSFAYWLSQHEPSWFSPIATALTLGIERVQPFLLLVPGYIAFTRGLAFVLAILLHGGIALTMTLGPFSYAMICLLLASVPAAALDAVWSRIPRRVRLRSGRALVILSTRLRNFKLLRRPPGELRPKVQRALEITRESVVVVLLLASLIQVTVDNWAIKHKLPQPWVFRELLMYPRMQQFWAMFSPDAPIDDGTLVVDAVTSDGRHLDPFTGQAPDFKMVFNGLASHPAILSDYFCAIRAKQNQRYTRELTRYLKNWQTSEGLPKSDRLVSYEAWWVNHDSPPRGSTTPTNFKKELVVKAKL